MKNKLSGIQAQPKRKMSLAFIGLLTLCLVVTGTVLAFWQPWVSEAGGGFDPGDAQTLFMEDGRHNRALKAQLSNFANGLTPVLSADGTHLAANQQMILEANNNQHVLVRLFESVTGAGHITSFTNREWRLVYISWEIGNLVEPVFTFWMTSSYRTSGFASGSSSANLNYNNPSLAPTTNFTGSSGSAIRNNITNDFNDVNQLFNIDDFIVTPGELPGSWQTTQPNFATRNQNLTGDRLDDPVHLLSEFEVRNGGLFNMTQANRAGTEINWLRTGGTGNLVDILVNGNLNTGRARGNAMGVRPGIHLSFGEVVAFQKNSALFQINNQGDGRIAIDSDFDTETYVINSSRFPVPGAAYLATREIEFLGWATTQARADAGTVDVQPNENITINLNEPMPTFFAVYQFSPARTITVQRGDGILAPINATTSFTATIRRPGQFLSPAGVAMQNPYFMPFAQIPTATGSGIEHIGWATSLQNARMGIVNPAWPIVNTLGAQHRLFDNTRIYAVWQRTDQASLQLRFSYDSLPSASNVNETWFNTTFPTITENFTSAQRTFTLSTFTPSTAVPYHAFMGWATNLARAQAGVVDHAPNATITIPYPSNQQVTALYAVFQPIRITLFMNSVFNVGISPTPQEIFATPTNFNLQDIAVITWDGNNTTLVVEGLPIPHGTAAFMFLGFASSHERAITGQVDFLGDGNPTTINVNRNIELHAVWASIGGTPLPPIEGIPPVEPPVEGMDRLPAPQNVQVEEISGNYWLSWNDVAGAIGFRVYINGHPTIFFPNIPYTITEINLSLFHFPLPPGETEFTFHLQVRAIGNNIDYTHSLLSQIVEFHVDDDNYNSGGIDIPGVDDDEDLWDDYWDDEQEYTQLNPPTNLNIAGNNLSWTGVANSAGYRIYVGGTFRTLITSGTPFDLSTLNLAAGTHQITLRANGAGNYTTSNHSSPVNFVVVANQVNWTFTWSTDVGDFSGSGSAGSALPNVTPDEPSTPPAPPLVALGGTWTWSGWDIDTDANVFIGSFTWNPPVPQDWTFSWDTSHGTASGGGPAGSALPGQIPSYPTQPDYPPLYETGGSWTWDGWQVDTTNQTFIGIFIWNPAVTQLEVPTNVRVYNNDGDYVLIWEEVDYADSYRIYINGNFWYETENFAVILANFPEGTWTFTIRATSNENHLLDSELSDALVINVDEDGNITVYPSLYPPDDIPPYTELPPGITTPLAPNQTTENDPTFMDWIMDNWYWILAGLLALLLLIILLIRRRRITNHYNTTNVNSASHTNLESNANAALAEARAKLKEAITQVNIDEHSPMAGMSVGKADQALDKAVAAVAEYKKSKTGDKK